MPRVATFDIETNGFLDSVTQIWCAVVKEHGIDVSGNALLAVTFRPNNIEDLPAYLDQFDILIGHGSIAFDFPVLRKIFGWEFKGTKIDTLVMSRTQRPNRRVPSKCPNKRAPHSVEAWGYRLGRHKVEHDEWDKFSDAMLKRCQEDVEIQFLIYEALTEEGRGEGWETAHKLNAKMFHHLQEQEEYGWKVDQPWMEECLGTLNRWMGRIDRSVVPSLPWMVEVKEIKKEGIYGYVKKPFKKNGEYVANVKKYFEDTDELERVVGPFSRVCFRRVSLDSNKEVKGFLLNEGWVPDEWNTNNVGERTSPKLSKNDGFHGVSGGLGKLVAKRVQCKQRKGILEGWQGMVRADGRVPTPVGGIATTGRLKHKGVVNVPSPHSGAFFARQMRQVFVASDGMVLVGADSKGNQVRQLAARMGDEEFTYAVLHGKSEEGTDIHSVNQRRSGAASRSAAKNFFYGFIFGAGDGKIGQQIGGSAADGKRLKEQYLQEMPLLRELIEDLTIDWEKTARPAYNKKFNRVEYANGYIRGLDGRPILVDSPHKILCYTLQSDEAIQMAVAYVMVHKRAEQRGWVRGRDWGMLIWMHDEFQMEARPEIAEELGQLACDAIKWSGEWLNIPCPHDGEYLIGENWYDTH